MRNYCRLITTLIGLVFVLSGPAFALRQEFLLFTDPDRRFSVEFPKDWRGDLLRLTCMALTSEFKKYDMTFEFVAESLKSAGELGAPPAKRP